jgi:hypothetical protein
MLLIFNQQVFHSSQRTCLGRIVGAFLCLLLLIDSPERTHLIGYYTP